MWNEERGKKWERELWEGEISLILPEPQYLLWLKDLKVLYFELKPRFLLSTSTSNICSLQGWLSLIILFRTSLIPPYSLPWDPLTHWCMTITGDRENSIFTQCRPKPNQRRTHQCLQYQFWKGLVYIDNFIWLWLT